MSSVEEAWTELREQWDEFNEAIRDIEKPFDQFYWIRTLSSSAFKYLLQWSKIIHVSQLISRKRGYFVQLIPAVAIGLVGITISSYVAVFHNEIIVKRWCHCDEEGSDSCRVNGLTGNNECVPSIIIQVTAIYLTFMIIFNYLQTTFRSPGVMLPVEKIEGSESASASASESKGAQKLYDERGGCCFFLKPRFNELRENELVGLYGEIVSDELYPEDGHVFIPSPNSSYCKKCKVQRPPRCHHCSRCNRCVLQMDHHCIWFNNCIGYNNYRTFLWTIIYLVVGCWYGVGLLFKPFYETIEKQLNTHGLKFLYENKTGFLDLPMPMTILKEILETGTLRVHLLVKIVFPFLFFVGLFLSSFLWSHLSYVSAGLTTLERMAEIQFMIGEKKANSNGNRKSAKVINPFHQGLRGNFRQVMGKSIWLGLLPLMAKPLPPYLPPLRKKKCE